MCEAEMKARNMIKGLSDKELLKQWNLTNAMVATSGLARVRGWLMDEIEERFPKGYNKWLEQDSPRDEDLKRFVRTEMRKRAS